MKILIVAINQEKLPSAVAPIGAASVVSILQKFDHDVVFKDFNYDREKLIERIDSVGDKTPYLKKSIGY